jgi:hypothetical protein
MSKLVHSHTPPKIKDWPKRPYKTIGIVINTLIKVFLLLSSGLLFFIYSIIKFTDGSTYDIYLPYFILGTLLLIPGVYYTYILICVLLGKEGYKYKLIPDMSQ